jgi:16S rRNA pseudouridine516 synthase
LLTLAKILQSQGIGTRRACEALILRGEVKMAGEICTDPLAQFAPVGFEFEYQNQTWAYQKFVYLALHKPVGYECSHTPQHHPSVFSLLPTHFRARGVQAVGRLDFDTSGLLLLSDDGQFIHSLASPKKLIGKTYLISTAENISAAMCAHLLAGVQLHGEAQPVRALACTKIADKVLQIEIAEGKYHQVKRMLAAVGNHVLALHRTAVGGYQLPENLVVGTWCEIAKL